MSKDSYIPFILLSSLFVIVSFVIGSVFGANIVRQEAIDRRYAIYHPQTGEFIWQCDLEKDQQNEK
jgi:hypothetical protein